MSKVKITNQGPEDKQDACNDVGLDSCEPLGLGDVGGDGVEDVDQDEEHRDEHRHPAGDVIRRDEEADPGDADEHGGGEVVGDDVVVNLPRQPHLETRHGIFPT